MHGCSARLPTETWIQILGMVAQHPSKDEFATEVEACEWFPSGSKGLCVEMDRGEESNLLGQRLALVMVCKAWYHIGIELLWSHLRPIVDTPTESLQRIMRVLKEKPHLTRLIRRLTIRLRAREPWEEQSEELILENSSMISTLIGSLPNLSVIAYPSIYAVAGHAMSPNICIVYSASGSKTFIPNAAPEGSRYLWNNSRVLSIDLEKVSAQKARETSLTRLEILHINLSGSIAILHAIKHWDMPSLRSLSVVASPFYDWVAFIRRARKTLGHLRLDLSHLNMFTDWFPVRGRTVEFPRLVNASLSVGDAFRTDIGCALEVLNLIRSPVLRRVTYCNIRIGGTSTSAFMLTEYVETAMQLYPSLNILSFEGFNVQGIDALFTSADLERWGQLGLEIRIGSGDGHWKTNS